MGGSRASKGGLLEESLRAYFLRAGLYALRGVPVRDGSDDLTDIDIWLYERPTGSSRRRQIVDAKAKSKPKAIERVFWVKGLAEYLGVDSACIATTDRRPALKSISRRIGVQILDGLDLKRIAESNKILFNERLFEEELWAEIRGVDHRRETKKFSEIYDDLKTSVSEVFGAGSCNRALENFAVLANELLTSHPNSDTARVATRLCYIAASIFCASLDFCLARYSFKSQSEKQAVVNNIIRYGAEDEALGTEKIRIAAGLVSKYIDSSGASAQSLLSQVRRDFQSVRAEVISEFSTRTLKGDGLFQSSRDLEFRAFSKNLPGFDGLSVQEKAVIGVLLDFVGLSRQKFSQSWQNGSDKDEVSQAFPAGDQSNLI